MTVPRVARFLAPVVIASLALVSPSTVGRPPLTVSGNKFVDPNGKTVRLRGVSSMGMAMVYGDKDRPGSYLPMSPKQYVDRAIQTDATGQRWYSTAIRLVFERFPSVNPSRLYKTENSPYAMPDTVPVAAWQTSHQYQEGEVASIAGKRFRAARKLWIAR